MARPAQFDREEVLDNALSVFWMKGFESASIQDLVDATGLNRGSLYNSFGDKADLFAHVMERYGQFSPAKPLVQALKQGASDLDPKALITIFFKDLSKRAQSDMEQKGCLLTNTTAGFYGCDDAMTNWIKEALSALESTLTKLVKRGQSNGNISATAKPRTIARSLVASAQGLNVMARSGANSAALNDIADQAVRVLDQ